MRFSIPVLLSCLLAGCPLDVPKTLDYACADGGDCPHDFACGGDGFCHSVLDGGGSCIGNLVSGCDQSSPCCEGRCSNGACCSDTPSNGGGACASDRDCCAGRNCQGGGCCVPSTSWALCGNNADCCGGHCFYFSQTGGSFCQPVPTPTQSLGQSCQVSEQCLAPAECGNGNCCYDDAAFPSGSLCTPGGGQCCPGLICRPDGKCCADVGSVCFANARCCSGSCVGNVCVSADGG
ncbi:MAG: hypothetical protein ACYCWW_11270 [Deltaproteobacteria bacterium]